MIRVTSRRYCFDVLLSCLDKREARKVSTWSGFSWPFGPEFFIGAIAAAIFKILMSNWRAT